MSETVDYNLEIPCKNLKEAKAIAECIGEIPDLADWDVHEYEGVVEVIKADGWRGGGNTCEELLQEWFAPFLQKFPHLGIIAHCTYIDQAPTDVYHIQTKEREIAEKV